MCRAIQFYFLCYIRDRVVGIIIAALKSLFTFQALAQEEAGDVFSAKTSEGTTEYSETGVAPKAAIESPASAETPPVEHKAPTTGDTPVAEDTTPALAKTPLVQDTTPAPGETPIVQDNAPASTATPMMEDKTPQVDEETTPISTTTPGPAVAPDDALPPHSNTRAAEESKPVDTLEGTPVDTLEGTHGTEALPIPGEPYDQTGSAAGRNGLRDGAMTPLSRVQHDHEAIDGTVSVSLPFSTSLCRPGHEEKSRQRTCMEGKASQFKQLFWVTIKESL